MGKTWHLVGLTLLTAAQIAFADIAAPTTSPIVAAAPMHRRVAKGVPNFGELNNHIWRSGQPTAEGYQYLAKQGLKTVVNLREEFPQDKDRIPAGVRYFYIPITDEHAPTKEQAKQFLEIASNPDNWPLLVHCHGGEGRAGVMAALARHALDGWDYKMVMKETGNFRVKHMGLFTTPMPSCQKKFIQEWVETPPSKSE